MLAQLPLFFKTTRLKMRKILALSIFFFVLILEASTNGDVSQPSQEYFIECHKKLENHENLMKELDMESHRQRKELIESCEPVIKCLEITGNAENYHGKKPSFDKVMAIDSYCLWAKFIESSPCYKKMKTSDSECLKSWRSRLPKEIREDRLARKKACFNYFGEDACVEQELIELCGKDQWVEFRDLFSDLSGLVWKDCKWSTISFGLVTAAVERSKKSQKADSTDNF